MGNTQRHIIGNECTQSPNQAKCNQNASLPPLLPLPSTRIVGPYQYDDCSRTAYWGDNLRCNMSNGKRHIIGDECTQWPNQAKCNQNGLLAPLLPLPSTHVDPHHVNDNCTKSAYWGDNLRCYINDGTRHIIVNECTP